MLAPSILDAIPFTLTILGKLTFFGLPLAAIVLTTIAGFRDSKWWLIVAGLSASILVYIFVVLSRPLP